MRLHRLTWMSCLVLAGLCLLPAAALATGSGHHPRYKVLVFTKGIAPQHAGATSAAVRAIREVGDDNGFRADFTGPARRRSPRATSSATARSCSSTRPATSSTTPSRPRSRATTRTAAASSPSTPAIETEPGWQFLTDVLGARATGARSPVGRATIKVADRVHEASKALPRVLDATSIATTTSTATSAASRTCSPRSTRRPTPAARWAPTTRSPGARTTRAGARSTPASATRRAASTAGRCQRHLGRRDRSGRRASPTRSTATAARPCWPTTSRPRSRRRRTSTSRSASTCCPTGACSRRRAAASCACTTRRRAHETVIATLPVYTNSEDGLYGPAIDNDFATNKWVYLYYAPPTVRIKQSDGTTADVTTPAGSAPATAADPSVWQTRGAGYFQLSRFKFVDGGDTPTARPRERAEDHARSPTTAARAATSAATSTSTAQQPVARHGRRHAVGRRQLGRLLAAQRQKTDETQTCAQRATARSR